MSTKHQSISSELSQKGGHLRCTTCDERRPLSESDIAYYLRNGWPKHCGYTMRWVTARELANEQEAT